MKKEKILCACHSNKIYENCCLKYHEGVLAENALVLMRSRYSAYALGLATYIIQTTHALSPHFLKDQKLWHRQILAFSQQISFNHLTILEVDLAEPESFVSFIADLSKKTEDVSFTEKSRFLKEGVSWKYIDGKIASGRLTSKQINCLS